MANEDFEASYEDDSSVMALSEDIDRQVRRLRNVAANPDQVTPAFLLGEMYGTLLPLLKDVLPYIARVEDHAGWATENLEQLGQIVAGGDEDSSQLAPSDAEKIKAVLTAIEQEARSRLALSAPTGDRPDADEHGRAQARLWALQEVITLVDDITLSPTEEDEGDSDEDDSDEGDSGDNHTEPAPAPEPPPAAAAEPDPTKPRAEE